MMDYLPEQLLVVVGLHLGGAGQDLRVLHAKVMADMAVDTLPVPPISTEEMQAVAFAAKKALAKILSCRAAVARRRRKR